MFMGKIFLEIFLRPISVSNFDSAIQLELLVMNGLEDSASSTVPGINIRKYHGLLVVALNPPVKHHFFLASHLGSSSKTCS